MVLYKKFSRPRNALSTWAVLLNLYAKDADGSGHRTSFGKGQGLVDGIRESRADGFD